MFAARLSVAQIAPGAAASGNVRGAVTDASGSVVVAAVVSLQPAGSAAPRTTITGQDGSFHFSAVEPGTYALTIVAAGFTDQKTNVSVVAGENPPLAPVVLQVAPAISKLDVGLPQHELATEQVHAEEKQRLLAIFPNFYVTYQPNPAPLTAAQKFQLGWKTIIDPEVILSNALSAGIDQLRHQDRQWGQGTEGYAKRFGADYGTSVIHAFIGHTLTQSVFHQDPRYFYKGTGSFGSRFLYAIGTAFVAKGDNGHWQPDYSDIIGGLAAREISNLYYPTTSRPGRRALDGFLLGFSGRAQSHLMQEFVFRKLTTHVPKMAARSLPILRDGTPVSLISVEDLRSGTPENARPIAFVLVKDVEVNGVVVAKAGYQGSLARPPTPPCRPPPAAPGTCTCHSKRSSSKSAPMAVPLRSTREKGGAAALEYHWLEDTGRVSLVLYTAQNIAFPPAK